MGVQRWERMEEREGRGDRVGMHAASGEERGARNESEGGMRTRKRRLGTANAGRLEWRRQGAQLPMPAAASRGG